MMENVNVEMVKQILQLVTVVVLAAVALMTVGFGGFILVIRQQGNAIEKIYLSISPESQKIIRDIVLGVKEAAQVADELTDGVVSGGTTTTTTTVTLAATEQPNPQG
jgi:hypothetical protein